jgi:hypothetical protein
MASHDQNSKDAKFMDRSAVSSWVPENLSGRAGRSKREAPVTPGSQIPAGRRRQRRPRSTLEISNVPAKGIGENLPTAFRKNPSAYPRRVTPLETLFRIIDTIRWSEEMQQRLASSGIPQLGNGVLAILDFVKIEAPPISAGVSVRIHRPDGTVIERRVDAVEIRHSSVGLFFAGLPDHEAPRLSRVELIH